MSLTPGRMANHLTSTLLDMRSRSSVATWRRAGDVDGFVENYGTYVARSSGSTVFRSTGCAHDTRHMRPAHKSPASRRSGAVWTLYQPEDRPRWIHRGQHATFHGTISHPR